MLPKMFSTKTILLFALTGFAVIVLIECAAQEKFQCKKVAGDTLPNFPAFSTDVRLNFKSSTVELRHYKDQEGKREGLEIFSQGRHVKYIVHGEQQLLITFFDKDYSTCLVTSSSKIKLEEKDSGPNGILQKILDVSQKAGEFRPSDSDLKIGIFLRKWEGCFREPTINVSFAFSALNWINPGNGTNGKEIPVIMEAEIGDDSVVGVIDNFQASMPEDIYFQPPEDVYCPGFREDKKPPEIRDFFSYDSEMIMHDFKQDIAPLVLHRTVHFDYHSNISRLDFHDLTPQTDDTKSKRLAKSITIIHDFSARIEYWFALPSLQCEVSEMETSEGVIEEKDTKQTAMITAQEYFGLNAKKISYNGQFKTRGYLADVYTAAVSHFDGTDGKSIYTWYFSSVETQVVENDKVEKNVLLRVVMHPESGSQRTDRIEMNLFNFRKQEPSADVFDISNCYDETKSKLFVITFPANKNLRGSENFLKLAVHLTLMEFTGLTKQRIKVSEVVFNKEFMFAEFKLLEPPSVLKKNVKVNGPSLSQVTNKLKAAVSDGSFKLSVSTDDGLVTVIPLKDGFNEFSGDRNVKDPNSFSQGSAIGLTIGMLILGFVLGGVVLNLVVSRKFGVSLFQRMK